MVAQGDPARGRRLPLHDEAAAYDRARAGAVQGWAWSGFAGAYQVVLLEGTEVVFIVLSLGAGGGLRAAAVGAALALAAVVLLGVALRRPLTRVPENTLKGITAVLLVSLGTIWSGEAIGVAWPGGAWGLPLVGLVWAAVAVAVSAAARRRVAA